MRAALVAVAVLAALAVAGPAAARDPKQPQQRRSAADTRQAHQIALGLHDLAAGWKLAPRQPPSPPCSTEPDESRLVQTAHVDPTFVWKDGVTSIGSEVDTFSTAAQALTDWRFSTLALLRSCLLETVRRAAGAKGKVRVAVARSYSTPKLGQRSLHYRFVFELNGNAATALVSEIVAFNVGRTSVVLHSLTIGSVMPTAALTALSSRLAQRLAAASGGI